MIQHNGAKENPNHELNMSFIAAIKELNISGLLFRCGIRKDSRRLKGESFVQKRTAFELFQFLLLMAFQGCNLYRYLGSKKQDIACSKSTYHRFLSNEHYNWRRFITLLAAKVTVFFDTLTKRSRFKALVLDDSVIGRGRSKAVELLAFVFDHVIGMLKNNRQMYHFNGGLYHLDSLAAYFARINTPGDILGSVLVRTKAERIPVKLVFVRNRNNRSEYIILLSTDCSLSDAEIIRRYGYRWSIECCFKVCKSLLKLGREFQPVNYDTTVSSTALVFTRFIILEWIRRKNSDYHSLGEIFFLCCDDVRDIELSDALDKLLSIIVDGLVNGTIQMDESVREKSLTGMCHSLILYR